MPELFVLAALSDALPIVPVVNRADWIRDGSPLLALAAEDDEEDLEDEDEDEEDLEEDEELDEEEEFDEDDDDVEDEEEEGDEEQ